ncbi:MAG: hypothetical protein BAJATHORv1_30286 [Candidatus Thorarchaeota archaeon]|nr:MAG: hypothetical protein BAJATHORv1_30286 [Candidatus Thorarchaeota archaeon]
MSIGPSDSFTCLKLCDSTNLGVEFVAFRSSKGSEDAFQLGSFCNRL